MENALLAVVSVTETWPWQLAGTWILLPKEAVCGD